MELDKIGAEVAPSKKQRELGIEILRILAMLLIVCQHFMNHGGFLKNADGNTFFLNLLNVLFSPSVNVFVLISGYFSASTTKFRASRTIELWLQVFFYSLSTIPLAMLAGANVSNDYVYQSFLPVTNKIYWFFSTYFVLALITPFLARLIGTISKKEHIALIGGVFLVGYLSTRFEIKTVFSLNYGYGILWFMMLFIVGAYFKKHPISIKKPILLVIYTVTVLLQLLFKYELNDTSRILIKLIYSDTNYNQPLTLIASICLLLLFLGIKSNGGRLHKAIIYVSSCTFGVYLFHESPIIRNIIYSSVFETQNYWGRPYSVLIVIAFALATFAAGVALESLRKLIFYLIKLLISFIKKEAATE